MQGGPTVDTVAEPKLHHYVPQLHLRRWANQRDQVAVRHRTRGVRVSSVDKTTAQTGLYKVPDRKLTAEFTIGDLEAASASVIDELCTGNLPPAGSRSRQVLALFMGLQINRTPHSLAILQFLYDVDRQLGPKPIGEDTMRQFLTKRFGFEPEGPEVGAACDFANGSPPFQRTGAEKREHQLQLMFDMTLKLAPVLEGRSWSLEAAREPNLITSDRPVVLWNPERPEDDFMGVGFDAAEIWLMVDPERMLVLRKQGPERVKRMGPERVAFVNRHIARHCSEEIIGHPDAMAELQLLPLARRRPGVRFWRGPLVNSPDDEEILHAWHPIRDLPDEATAPG